jgi:hypothetical protein
MTAAFDVTSSRAQFPALSITDGGGRVSISTTPPEPRCPVR